MKATKGIIAGIGLLAAAGLIVYIVRRQKTNRVHKRAAKQAEVVSEHGYETAHDILFPKKNKGVKKYKYGPV